MRDCECLARVVVVNNQEASGREMRRKRVGEKSSCATQILLLLIINNPTRDAACSLEVGWSQGLSREKRSKLRPFLRLAFEPEDEERYGITTSPPPRPASSTSSRATWRTQGVDVNVDKRLSPPIQVKSSQAISKSSQVKSSQVKSRQVKSSQVKSSHLKVKSSQVKSSQVKSSQVNSRRRHAARTSPST